MKALVDAVCAFFTPDSGYIRVMDSNATLKYHQSAECLSLVSSKMSATVLKKWSNDTSLSGAGQADLVLFDVDISHSKKRHQCFTTTRIKNAQVRFLQ